MITSEVLAGEVWLATVCWNHLRLNFLECCIYDANIILFLHVSRISCLTVMIH